MTEGLVEWNSGTISGGKVWFSSVQRAVSLNLELN